MEQWIEVEDGYLTNQPTIYKRGVSVPDEREPATEAYMFTWQCKRTKRGVTRRRKMEVIPIDQVYEFATKPGVVLVPSVRNPPEYARCRRA